MKIIFLLSLLVLFHSIQIICCAKILVLVLSPSPSHNIFFQPIIKELSLQGHQVTSITPYPVNNATLINLKEINIYNETTAVFNVEQFLQQFQQSNNALNHYRALIPTMANLTEVILKHQFVQDVIHNSQQFDLFMMEYIWTSALYNLKSVLNCPMIGMISMDLFYNNMIAVGNPANPSYFVDHQMWIGSDLTFRQRLENLLYTIAYNWMYFIEYIPFQDELLKQYFISDAPLSSWKLEQSVDLILVNYNPILNPIRPIVPNVITIGGVQTHSQFTETCSQKLQQFLDNSKNGVIYMSLGSNIKSSNLPEQVITQFLDAFKSLPYNVVWKWENKDLLPKAIDKQKIFIEKWLPQRAVLDHPNVKLFIMQGGIHSIDEAIKSKVPLIGIPFGGDQQYNTERIRQLKIGNQIQLKDLTSNKLRQAIVEILTNPEYKSNIIKIENLLSDQETKPLDHAIWWIEYVLRHGGAQHLRSPGADLPWYKFLMLDVILFLIVLLIFAFAIIIFLLQLIVKYCQLYFMRKKQKTQ